MRKEWIQQLLILLDQARNISEQTANVMEEKINQISYPGDEINEITV